MTTDMAPLAARAVALLASFALLLHPISAYITADEQAMLEWIQREGGEFKVTIGRNAAGVRGVFTTQDVKEGEVIIHIPDHLVFSVRSIPAAEAAPSLLKELHTPCSRFKPYWQILPSESQVLTGYNFPSEYIKYLADDHLEELVLKSFKQHCVSTLDGHNDQNLEMTIPEAIGNVNITLPYWEYVVSILSSRTFSLRKAALSMVPLLDLVNHDIRDINNLDSSNAPGVRLIAGKDLAKGEEVTISYGNMRSDDLLLYYGFLDTISYPPRLFSVDHRKFAPYESEELDDEPLTGPAEEVEAEIERLKGVLSIFEQRLQELGPIPETNPYMAGMLKAFHEQRRSAILHELHRLGEALRALQNAEL